MQGTQQEDTKPNSIPKKEIAETNAPVKESEPIKEPEPVTEPVKEPEEEIIKTQLWEIRENILNGYDEGSLFDRLREEYGGKISLETREEIVELYERLMNEPFPVFTAYERKEKKDKKDETSVLSISASEIARSIQSVPPNHPTNIVGNKDYYILNSHDRLFAEVHQLLTLQQRKVTANYAWPYHKLLNTHKEEKFSRTYDLSRVLHATLRLFILDAIGHRKNFDPATSSKKTNNVGATIAHGVFNFPRYALNSLIVAIDRELCHYDTEFKLLAIGAPFIEGSANVCFLAQDRYISFQCGWHIDLGWVAERITQCSGYMNVNVIAYSITNNQNCLGFLLVREMENVIHRTATLLAEQLKFTNGCDLGELWGFVRW